MARFFCCRPVWALPPPPRDTEGRQRKIQYCICGPHEEGVRGDRESVSTITNKVEVYAPAERADKLPLFLLYPYMYSTMWVSQTHGS